MSKISVETLVSDLPQDSTGSNEFQNFTTALQTDNCASCSMENYPAPALATSHGVISQLPISSQQDIFNRLDEILEVLKDSTIAVKGGKDIRSRFWDTHRRVAEEREGAFLERHNSDMDIVLVFSGLFSGVNTSFIVAMGTRLVPNPSDTTNVLLTQLVQIGLGNHSAAATLEPASTWSPSKKDVLIQAIAYSSLSMSLLAAFGAVMGKQWLGYYKASRYGHGSPEDRGRRRQMKMDGLDVWYFNAVVQSFPMLLQFSLLLFGISISADMWYRQRSISWVIISSVMFGILFYLLTVLASLSSTVCPYQTPSSAVLRFCGVDKFFQPIFRWTVRHAQATRRHIQGFKQNCLHVMQTALRSEALIVALTLASISIWGPPLLMWYITKTVIFSYIPTFTTRLQSFASQSLSRSKSLDNEALADISPKASRPTLKNVQSLDIPDTLSWSLDAPAVKWLLDTSTDPEVFLAAASLVPEIEWPLHLDISDILHQLRDTFMTCFDIQDQLISRSKVRAIICATALNHIYCESLPRSVPRALFDTVQEGERFTRLWKSIELLDSNLSMVSILGLRRWIFEDRGIGKLLAKLSSHESDMPLVWLSHVLPYCISLKQRDTPDCRELDELSILVIDTLLLSSAPSGQIIANCALLACQMLGCQFEWKDLARVDKSDAVRKMTTILAMEFQRLLGQDGSAELSHPHELLHNTPQSQRFLRAIFKLFHLAPYDPRLLKRELIANNLAYCKKAFESAHLRDDKESNWDSDIRSILRFVVTTGCQSHFRLDQTDNIWSGRFSWEGDSRSPEHFSWLVAYLNGLDDPNDADEEVVTHILLVLSGMRQLGSSTEWQIAYLKCLLSFMQPNRSCHVRYAALRAAHDARSALASIKISSDAALPSILLHEIWPFHPKRDLFILRLVFALARDDTWKPYLLIAGCVERCVAIIEPSLKWYLHPFYLIGFLSRMMFAEPALTDKQWRKLTTEAWCAAAVTDILLADDDAVDALQSLVQAAMEHVVGYRGVCSKDALKQLDEHVTSALKMLERRAQKQPYLSPEQAYAVKAQVVGLKRKVHEALAVGIQTS